MKQLAPAIVLSLALAVVLGAARLDAQPPEPAAVIDAYTAALNAHDVEGALQYVAEDAVYYRPGGTFTGKAEVRGFIEDLVTRNVRVELIGERTVEGELVSWMSRVTLDDPQNPGGPPMVVQNLSSSIVRDGLIVTHTAMRAP